MNVDLAQEFVGQCKGKLLAVGALGRAGELAVEIDLVMGRKALVDRKRRRIGHRQQDNAARDRGILQNAEQLENGLGTGVLIAMDRSGNAHCRSVRFAQQFMHQQHGIRAVGERCELVANGVDGFDHSCGVLFSRLFGLAAAARKLTGV